MHKANKGLRTTISKIKNDLRKIEEKILTQPNDKVLNNVEIAVLALEDHRFFTHSGIDIYSVAREIVRTVLRRPHGGASTIEMQFVRTVTGYKERTLKRKMYEMLLALITKRRYQKLIILRSYLTYAYFGSHAIGIEQASSIIFGKASRELSWEEAFYIASALVYPRPLHPSPVWNAKILRRAKYGEKIVKKLHY